MVPNLPKPPAVIYLDLKIILTTLPLYNLIKFLLYECSENPNNNNYYPNISKMLYVYLKY